MRASLTAVVLLCVPMLVSALAMPVRPMHWSAMQDEAVDVLRQCSMMAGVKFVYDILRFAQ